MARSCSVMSIVFNNKPENASFQSETMNKTRNNVLFGFFFEIITIKNDKHGFEKSSQ